MKKVGKKLTLNKETISALTKSQMSSLEGGASCVDPTAVNCPWSYPYCNGTNRGAQMC
ncbi:MAG: class I lanthipeptide [Flammeovirgaceae bacterium]